MNSLTAKLWTFHAVFSPEKYLFIFLYSAISLILCTALLSYLHMEV